MTSKVYSQHKLEAPEGPHVIVIDVGDESTSEQVNMSLYSISNLLPLQRLYDETQAMSEKKGRK